MLTRCRTNLVGIESWGTHSVNWCFFCMYYTTEKYLKRLGNAQDISNDFKFPAKMHISKWWLYSCWEHNADSAFDYWILLWIKDNKHGTTVWVSTDWGPGGAGPRCWPGAARPQRCRAPGLPLHGTLPHGVAPCPPSPGPPDTHQTQAGLNLERRLSVKITYRCGLCWTNQNACIRDYSCRDIFSFETASTTKNNDLNGHLENVHETNTSMSIWAYT